MWAEARISTELILMLTVFTVQNPKEQIASNNVWLKPEAGAANADECEYLATYSGISNKGLRHSTRKPLLLRTRFLAPDCT